MSYLDSPIGFCEVGRTIVLTDQTQKQCAFEHDCPPGRNCPLHNCFARISGITEAELPKTVLEACRRAGSTSRRTTCLSSLVAITDS